MRSIENRKMVYIRESPSVFEKKIKNLELSLEIGSKKYFSMFMGFPINAMGYTKTRQLLYKM